MDIKFLRNRICIICFAVFMASIWVFGGIFFVFNSEGYRSYTDSSGENREKATIEVSELWDSGESISSFVDDRFPFRNLFIKVYKKFSGKIDLTYQKAATAIGSKFYKPTVISAEVIDNETTDEEDTKTDEINWDEIPEESRDLYEYLAPVVVNDVLYGRRTYLFMYGEEEINYYIGNNLLDEATLASYAEKLNTLKALCDARGIELYLIFPANKSQFYAWLMPTIEVETDYKRTARLCDYLTEHTSVPVNYLLDDVQAWELQYGWMAYFPYDTHWNTSGAMGGVYALYNMMGMETTNPLSFFGEYLGAPAYDLAAMAGIDVSTLPYSVEYTVNYKDEISVEGLDTEADVCRTVSTSANQKNFVLIGDSFRKAMERYLAKDFSNCTFAHRDSVEDITSDILNSNVLVLETIERQDYEAFEMVDYLITLLQ